MRPAFNRLREEYPEGGKTELRLAIVDAKYIAFYNTRHDRITLNTEDIKLDGNQTKAYWLLVLFHEYQHVRQCRNGTITTETSRMYKESPVGDVRVQVERDADVFAIRRFWRHYAMDLGRGAIRGYLKFCDVRGNYLPKPY